MDSVTQFALGAAVSAAILGPRIGARRAMLLGGVLGTLPDLDTFFPSANPVEAFTSHRGPTHSLVVHALATPFIAEPLVRVVHALKDARVRSYLAVYLVFATHALIDAMTVYGTRLFWPLIETPVGVGSIFIIDPLYTLPLVIVTIWALFLGGWTPRYGRAVSIALVASSLYMAATVPLQAWMTARAAERLQQIGFTAERLLVIPTPFNVLYWRAIAVGETRYVNLYLPVVGSGGTAYAHPTSPALADCLASDPTFRSLAAFTKGFYSLNAEDDRAVFADLRMGLTPQYVFRFVLGKIGENGVTPLETPTREDVVRSTEGDLPWLFAGLSGQEIARPAEKSARIDNDAPAQPRAIAQNLACTPISAG